MKVAIPKVPVSHIHESCHTKVPVSHIHVHIKVFKKAIKANGETMDVDTINVFGFTLLDNIS